ncbi:MAG: PDZ domain-containing protein [Lawsonibacter sp.]|nr:PDZ domain-containing protein [Lawsonibacter sp.]
MKKLLSSLLALTMALSLAVLPASALELEDAKKLLAIHYVDGVAPEVLELDSLDAILEAIGDPYTFYMTPEQYQSFNQSVNGRTVVGIGATVETAYDGGYRVMSVLPDSPALEAGIQPGDILTAVDGVPTSPDVDPRVPVTGEEGTVVTLTVNRNGQVLEFTLTRRAVNIPIVTYEQVGSAGVIDCISFGATTAQSIQEAIRELDDDTAVWIMDLRANPGGDSGATATSASLFTGSGIMLYFRDGSGRYNYSYTMPGFPDMTDKPVIVLTSEHSASGSELFAGDMRTYRAGIALGQRSFGKGTAQIIFDETNSDVMVGGEAMKITTYRFFSPDGATNHVVGVLPTLLISPENTSAAALLLTSPKPARAKDFLKLELAGQTFYIDVKEAVKAENKAAFVELLEALPPSAKLYEGSGVQSWTQLPPAQLAQQRGLPFTSRSFPDTVDCTYAREIDTLAAYHILNGYEDGNFHPDDTLTRAQFVTLVASALDLPAGKGGQFSDVQEGQWFAAPVSAMTDMGFLSGRGDGTFGPNDTITYQEMVTVLSNVAAWTSMDGYDLNKSDLLPEELVEYYDWAEWARVPARNLDALEALTGELAPTDLVTRELAAATLCRLMESTHLIWN